MDSEQLEKRRQAFRLQEELLKRPELARIQQIDRLTDSFTIFGKNYSDLKQLLTLITLHPEGLELFEQDNVQAREQALREVTRLLHNFVAAATSIVDHAKALHRRLHEKTNSFPDFKVELDKRFFRNGLAVFVRELRNHLLHSAVIGLGATMQWTRDSHETVRTVCIAKSKLTITRWPKEAQDFLQTIPDQNVNVTKTVDDYRAIVEQFVEWLYARFRTIHEEDYRVVSEYKKKMLELRLDEVAVHIRERLAGLKKGFGTMVDVLTPFLTSADFIDLPAPFADLEQWTKKALEKIEIMVRLPEDLKRELLTSVTSSTGQSPPNPPAASPQ